MPFPVLLTKDAASDLDELYDYVTVHDSPGKADCVLKKTEETFSALSEFPDRRIYPKELLKIGIREYCEIFFKPYRIIYRIVWGTITMKILLTNDDGIHAPGLFALFEALKGRHELHIVAPEAEMSAVGHAITLVDPIRVKKVRKNGTFFGYAVSGTPADCVKIAVQEILDPPPDMILSGINLGNNVGINILYSGTVSAATEGAFLGIPSAAISMGIQENQDFTFAAGFSGKIIRLLLEGGLNRGTALNVNIPPVTPEKIKGVCLARQGTSWFEERFEKRCDPRGNVYYWLAGERFIENGNPENDSVALKDNKITITPIHYDLTAEKELERLRDSRLLKKLDISS